MTPIPHICKPKANIVWFSINGAQVNYPTPNCPLNLYVAVRNRVTNAEAKVGKGVLIPIADGVHLNRLQHAMKQLRKLMPKNINSMSYSELVDSFPKHKKAFYMRRLERMNLNFRAKKHASKIFTKEEKLEFSEEKGWPIPRVVTCYRPEINMEIIRFLRPIEKEMFAVEGDGKFFPQGLIFGKGLTPERTCEVLREKWNSFTTPVAVLTDAARYDRHITKEVYYLERKFWLEFNKSNYFRRLMDAMEEMHSTPRDPTIKGKVKGPGQRGSGHPNTSCGNNLLMACMMAAFCNNVGIKYQMLDNGDDCVIIVELKDLKIVNNNISNFFSGCGFTIKVETVAFRFEDIKFCQMSPYYNNMIRNHHRILSRFAVIPSAYANNPGEYLLSVAMCEMSLNNNVPITHEVMYEVYLKYKDKYHFNPTVLNSFKADYYNYSINLKKTIFEKPQISSEDRIYFYQNSGISPDRQLSIVSKFKYLLDNIAFGQLTGGLLTELDC